MSQDSFFQIMQRYDPTFRADVSMTYDKLRELDINHDFVLSLLHTFEQTESFSKETFDCFPLSDVVDYIQRTHKYYLSKKLLEIEQSIYILTRDYSDHHPLLPLLSQFYNNYTAHLTEHIDQEEHELLPYIGKLSKAMASPHDAIRYSKDIFKYSIQSFIDHHDDTEQDLSDIRRVIRAYDPPKTNQSPYRILLAQLKSFEKDLCVHALIEDHVLIPRAMKLEEEAKSRLRVLLS